MMKRFLSLFAILAISLLAACADVNSGRHCPMGGDCCGARPCDGGQNVASEDSKGKMCDPAMKKKHKKRHHGVKAAPAAKAPAAAAPAAAPTIPVAPVKSEGGVLEGVKKMIQDVKKPH